MDEAAQDELVPIVFNNNYQKSKKIYGVQAAAVGVQLGEEKLKQATQEVSEGWNQSGLACLVTEGKKATGTAALTKANIKETLIGSRKEAVEKKFAPDVVICSPATFATILAAAGSFARSTSSSAVRSGTLPISLRYILTGSSTAMLFEIVASR